MARVWVLDTETKGTGAEMVPLDKVLREPAPPADRVSVVRRGRRSRAAPAPPEPREPWRFKVVDVMTRQVLADGIDARATVQVLGGVRSIVDVLISVWDPADEEWRLLPLRDRRALWERRRPPGSSARQGPRRGPAP